MRANEIDRRLRRMSTAAEALELFESCGNLTILVSSDDALMITDGARLPYLGYLMPGMSFIPDSVEHYRSFVAHSLQLETP